MSDTLFQKLHSEYDDINFYCGELTRLSRAFAVTGNESAADVISGLSNCILRSKNRIQKHCSDDLDRQLKQTQVASAEFFNTIAKLTSQTKETKCQK